MSRRSHALRVLSVACFALAVLAALAGLDPTFRQTAIAGGLAFLASSTL